MLYGHLQVIIDYKLDKDKSKIKAKAAFNALHLLVLCTHLIFLYDNAPIVWVLLFLTTAYTFQVALAL